MKTLMDHKTGAPLHVCRLCINCLLPCYLTNCTNTVIDDIIYPEQRGCRRRARVCKDHLMINKAILEDAHQCQKNLSMGWVDFLKAFDSIWHEWLLQVLRLYKCPGAIMGFLEMVLSCLHGMLSWRLVDASVTTDPIVIHGGIFQGDSLSPLLFCLEINTISTVTVTVNHFLYKVDLKFMQIIKVV